jgi:hypothetical protein
MGTHGRDIAQGFIFRLPTVTPRVRTRVKSCEICGWLSGTGAGSLQVLRFSLTTTHKTHIVSCDVSTVFPKIVWKTLQAARKGTDSCRFLLEVLTVSYSIKSEPLRNVNVRCISWLWNAATTPNFEPVESTSNCLSHVILPSTPCLLRSFFPLSFTANFVYSFCTTQNFDF